VQFEITEQTRSAIGEWLAKLDVGRGRYLFPSRFREQPHISTRQYARIVQRWVARAGLDSSAYGTHSMRRTKPAQIYKKTGQPAGRAAIAGAHEAGEHRSISRIEVDDALAISEQVELWTMRTLRSCQPGPRCAPHGWLSLPYPTLPVGWKTG
jgi:integrase